VRFGLRLSGFPPQCQPHASYYFNGLENGVDVFALLTVEQKLISFGPGANEAAIGAYPCTRES